MGVFALAVGGTNIHIDPKYPWPSRFHLEFLCHHGLAFPMVVLRLISHHFPLGRIT
jgi:hypothetical protein